MTEKLKTPVQYLKGVGPKVAKLLMKLGISTIEDLLFYFPYDYEDRRNFIPISSIRSPTDKVLIRGEIVKIEHHNARGRFSIIKTTVSDRGGSIKTVFFNQPYLLKLFKAGMKIIVSGKAEIDLYGRGLQIVPRDWEMDDGEAAKIVPIYHLTGSLFAKYLRKIIRTALNMCLSEIVDPLPEKILAKYKFPALKTAVQTLHFPPDFELMEICRKRIIFEDFFLFQLSMGIRKKEILQGKGISFVVNESILKEFKLPFELTQSQKKVISEIYNDMKAGRPMSRLLQGDVGSGKTVVAALSAFVAVKNGYQAAVMAPTEILAVQHYEKMGEWLKDLKIKLVTGTTQRKNKKKFFDEDLIVGTHALIEGDIKFKKLGLVIVDEQHRFGVLQRHNFAQKGVNPDILFMTATPIPRSLALTLYGDLDRSVISELPPGRVPVKTHYVPDSKRKSAYEFMRQKLREGRQIFIVCPLVAESQDLDLKAAEEEAVKLQSEIFKEYKVGLVHGRMKSDKKDKIMLAFRDKKIHILVSTTVIEVGIDVPNASIMVVEHAERFGLSQLHQLRGRIGRGENESFCFLMGNPKSEESKIRIKAMLDTNDGFKISEIDLRLRGPGDFYGVRQSGLPKFRMADIIRDENILLQAREEVLNYLKEDPTCALLQVQSAGEKLKFLKAA